MVQLIMDFNTVIPIILVIVGFVLIIAELLIGLDSLFDLVLSGTALLIAGSVGYLVPSWPVSIVLALLLLVVYWFLGRNYVHKFIDTHPRKTNADRLVGQTSTVSRVRADGKAFFAKFGGEEWKIESDADLAEDLKVVVTTVKGAILEVEIIK